MNLQWSQPLVVLTIAVAFFQCSLQASAETQPIERGRVELSYFAEELVDAETLGNLSDVISPDDIIDWKVYAPTSYDPDNPAGLFVYISPTAKGHMPRGWQAAFDDENLIWISADNSGNKTPAELRMLYAVLAPEVIKKLYRIDTTRVYLSGFSGGGKMASMVSVRFADLFKGGIFIGGAEFWRTEPPLLSTVRQNRYVFVSGTRDFNLELTKHVYRKFRHAEIPNLKLMVIRNMGHTPPGVEEFREALHYLDDDE